MANFGRPAGGNKLTVLDAVKKQRPQPIPGMTRYARTVWKKIVAAHDPDHFKPQMLEQLRVYCEACSSHKKSILEIRKTGEIITQENKVTKRNPWTLERDACAAVMASIGTKLQLNVNSTTKAGEAPKPKSKREGLLFKG